MKLSSSGLRQDGRFDDKYGKRGKAPCSLPFRIEDAPEGTRSFAVYFEDKDSIPVCGFAWIHWLISDLRNTEVPEGAAQDPKGFTQGSTSLYRGLSNPKFGGVSRADSCTYVPMAPPDKPHCYELHVYALDTILPLPKGFYWNELYHAMAGHVLEEAVLSGWYDA